MWSLIVLFFINMIKQAANYESINQSIQVGELRIVIIWSLRRFHLKWNFVPNKIFSTKANSNKFYNFKCFRGISAGDNLLIAANCQLILMPSFTYRVEVLFSRCTLNLVNIIIRKRSFAFGRINLSSNNLGSTFWSKTTFLMTKRTAKQATLIAITYGPASYLITISKL